jgi:restriction system protein
MDYQIGITNSDDNTKELFEGPDVNKVLQEASYRYFQIQSGNSYNNNETTRRRLLHEAKKYIAQQYTQRALEFIEKKKSILEKHDKYKIDLWQILNSKIAKEFTEDPPRLAELAVEPHYCEFRQPPQKNDANYISNKNISDLIFKNNYNKKLFKAEELYKNDYNSWENERIEIERGNRELKNGYNEENKRIEAINKEILDSWNSRKNDFYNKVKKELSELDDFMKAYFSNEKEAIEKCNCELLKLNQYPLDFWDKQVFVNFNDVNDILYVEFYLPSTYDLDTLKEIKYNQSKDVFNEINMSPKEFEKYYDDIIYQITIFILYTICLHDENNCIEAIAFNGYVKSIDKASGTNIEPCIISLFVKKEDIMRLNLKQIDAHICFRNLKGVGASVLANLTPVPPIINFDKSDKRFIQAKEVANTLNDSVNLAAMDWEDFEHLIREIFEKEFQSNGGEVKVTQASRDGGVDAIAFDPDPIRGGKIVIQAKRYTNTVGVSAVRDLYGTVHNEGATKGILVSTADYGSDAYEFAKGKPLTLLNGANLLHLLEKHGHHAHINLNEAKKILADKDKYPND